MSSVKKEARLSGMLLARKGTAQPAHTDHRLNMQVMEQYSELEPFNDDLVEAVKEINRVTKKQYNSVLNSSDVVSRVESNIKAKKELQDKASNVSDQFKQNLIPVKQKKLASKKIAMTLRMEMDDHLKLRLYSAHSRKSCQEIITEALEEYLEKTKKYVN